MLITFFKHTVSSIAGAAHIMDQRHDQPVSFGPCLGSDLILVKSKRIFALSEEQFNRPPAGVCIKYLLRRHICIGRNKYPQCFGIRKCFLWITYNYHGVWNIVEFPFISIDIKFTVANGHKADIRIPIFDSKGKFADFLADSTRIDDTVVF